MAQILRVSIMGTMPSGEVWSINPCWEINGSAGEPVSPAECLTIATALGGVVIPAAVLGAMAPQTNQTGYRVEARDLSGVLENQAEYIKPAPTAGTGSAVHPYQSSVVVSLRTPLPGARYRGRLYWPATGIGLINTTYRIDPVVVTNFLAGFKTYLSSMETAIQATLPEANLTVWSRTNSGFANVTSIRVGNVVDTQRRRRDAAVEVYNSTSYP